MGEHCCWAACLKLSAAAAVAVAAAAAAAAGPDEKIVKQLISFYLQASQAIRYHQHLLGLKKLGTFFTAALAVQCISPLLQGSRPIGCICSIPAKRTPVLLMSARYQRETRASGHSGC